MDLLTTGKSRKGAARLERSGGAVGTSGEVSKSRWTRSGNSSGGFLLDKSYNLYPLVPKGYPRKIHAFALGSNLDLFLVKVEA